MYHHNFYENRFDSSAAGPQQQIESLCKTLVLVAIGKTLYFRKIVRNDDVTPFKNRKNGMQVSFGIYWLWVDLETARSLPMHTWAR